MSNIKQAPFLGLTGMGGGGTGLALGGAVAKKTYLDDVFSTYLYKGNGSARSINNGINLSSEGGLVWMKSRTTNGYDNLLQDTGRGTGKYLKSNDTNGQISPDPDQYITSFNANGFSLGTENDINNSSQNFASWTFRKAKGFFDVVTYDGDSGSPNWGTSDIPHNLGCIPGLIILKKTSGTGGWWVYHRDLPAASNPAWSKVLRLDNNDAEQNAFNFGTASYHTATTFRVGNDNSSNNTGDSYVAYLFAGGESTSSKAISNNFGGSDYMSIADHADFDVGTNWTAECWFNADSLPGSYNGIFGQWSGTGTNGWVLEYVGTELRFYWANSGSYKELGTVPLKQWHHVAISKEGSTTRIFLNGTQVVADFDMGTISASSAFTIGGMVAGGGGFDGKISNVRIVKGTAVYTSSFRPSYEPLANITNTVLLCLQDSSSTSNATVTPGTITINGGAMSSHSPFDDPEGFKFGEEGDQNIIKCGMWEGTGTAGLEINVGWQPSWILFKNASSSSYNWYILDVMRGISYGSNFIIKPNENEKEFESSYLTVTPTGFKIETNHALGNASGSSYVYMALRFPDGFVAKPPEAATDVFAIDTGDGDSTIPNFDSGFPVAFALQKPLSQGYTGAFARLMGNHVLYTPTTGAEQDESDGQSEFDSNLGYGASSAFQTSGTQAYMWKRGAGFEVVTYIGNSTGETSGTSQVISHNLNSVPEMIWVKTRDASGYWGVYHKGLNGGTNPENYRLLLNDTHAESAASGGYTNWYWNNTAPTATHFSVGEVSNANAQNHQIIAMLFASVSGISRVGSYSGSGSTGNAQNIGFQPRYLLIKRRSATSDWMQFNSLSGFGNYMQLNTNQQQNSQTYVNVSATGFSLVSDYGDTNENGSSYIYYAHA